MQITFKNGPHENLSFDFKENSVSVLIGKNGSGKSKILQSIKSATGGSDGPIGQPKEGQFLLLKGNFENIQEIQTINPTTAKTQQVRDESPSQVTSLIAADPILVKIFSYFFKALFDIDLTIKGANFQSGAFDLGQEAEGLRSLFNLLYYLISPHKYIHLDEPERFLHPSMRGLFISILSEIANNYEKTIILSSHSHLSVRYDLDNVYVLQVQKDPPNIIDIKAWRSSLTSTMYTQPKDKSQFINWFQYHTNVLFSKNACLVEGLSDQVILEALKNKFCLQYGLENISINHVGASNHESGGKGRLHKYQHFLNQLCPTFIIADEDIIGTDLTKWFTPTGTSTSDKILEAKNHNLHILSRGEIEDYYFIDPSFDYCTDVATAKANKISAAYEQAKIIYSKTAKEVDSQFEEVIKILAQYSPNAGTEHLLKSIAKEFIVDKYAKGITTSDHIKETIVQNETEISFKFTSSAKVYKIPSAEIDKMKIASSDIDKHII